MAWEDSRLIMCPPAYRYSLLLPMCAYPFIHAERTCVHRDALPIYLPWVGVQRQRIQDTFAWIYYQTQFITERVKCI